MGTIKSANYRKPAYLLILLDILGFGLLYISKSYNMNVLVICRMGDKFIMLMAFMLMSIGVLLLCRINLDYGFRQIIWILVGGAAFFVAYFIYYNIKIWDRFWYIYFAIGVGLFLFTLVLGTTINGSKNWVSFGPITFQPSEITKIMYIMCLACYYSGAWSKPVLGKLSPKWITLAITYIFVGFLVLQRDWGTILVLFSIYLRKTKNYCF